MPLRIPHIDSLSFWVGFIVASIFWWIIGLLRPTLRQIRENAAAKRQAAKSRTASNVEEHYRKIVLHKAQGMHLAAPLFSLDEIGVLPKLLAPPVRTEPGVVNDDDDIVAITLPYLPAWPEMASIYRAPTLTLAEALSGDSDVVLTGNAGTGKTVALAHLASRLARQEYVEGLARDTLPLLIHVADLNLPIKDESEALALVIELLLESASIFDQSRLPDFIRNAFADGRILFLLDGTDELTPIGLEEVIEFIKAIKRTHPKTHVVTTANPEYLDGLVSLNFVPFGLATWNDSQINEFLEKWTEMWERFVSKESWAQAGLEQIDNLILTNWLKADSALLTPLEITLKTWGLFAGDLRGPKSIDFIESHIRRLTPSSTPPEALELLALQVTVSMEPVFEPRKAREWIKEFEPADSNLDAVSSDSKAENQTDETKITKKTASAKKSAKKKEKVQAPSSGLIAKMVASGLLVQHRYNRMRFLNPVFGGYLAGKALANYNAEIVLEQPYSISRTLSLKYLAFFGDATSLSEKLLQEQDRPLERNLFTVARWLKDAPSDGAWQGPVMARLAKLLQQEGQPLALRGQALAAIILSGDSSAALLLRQLCETDSPELLQICPLGCGVLQDAKSIPVLNTLLTYPIPGVRRAACLALAAINNTTALEAVASVLLHGDETTRRNAAEALANRTGDGHDILKEAATMDDVLVRHAAVYGLGRVNQAWADEILAHMQIEDSEWIVRNAATGVIERRQQPNPHIPKRLPNPSESPWLIAFAGKQGLGVSPDKPVTGLLLSALKSGSEDEQLAALSYLRMIPAEGVFGALYQAMYGGNFELREAAFVTLWEMAARGVDVPDPQQFGIS